MSALNGCRRRHGSPVNTVDGGHRRLASTCNAIEPLERRRMRLNGSVVRLPNQPSKTDFKLQITRRCIVPCCKQSGIDAGVVVPSGQAQVDVVVRSQILMITTANETALDGTRDDLINVFDDGHVCWAGMPSVRLDSRSLCSRFELKEYHSLRDR